MIINVNILAILRAFSNLQKKMYENVYTKEITFKAATTESLLGCQTRKLSINNQQLSR